jgi:cyclophilin family peptidyl-prolyl cis-trans isomerase
LKLKHNKRGVLSMGNGGKNSNTSQFFVTLKDLGAPICDRKHVVFGQLKYGFDTLDLMQELIDAALADNDLPPKAGEEEFPPLSIIVTGCGEWTPGTSECTSADTGTTSVGNIIQGYYDESDVFIPTFCVD